MKITKNTHVMLLKGGFGSERDVSLRSAKACAEAIKENDLNYEFNDNIVNEVKGLDQINNEGRVDLRSTSLVTIDGENARDFDDAVYAEKLSSKKGWRILVAIADVSHYVKLNSYLDKN